MAERDTMNVSDVVLLSGKGARAVVLGASFLLAACDAPGESNIDYTRVRTIWRECKWGQSAVSR